MKNSEFASPITAGQCKSTSSTRALSHAVRVVVLICSFLTADLWNMTSKTMEVDEQARLLKSLLFMGGSHCFVFCSVEAEALRSFDHRAALETTTFK